MAVVRETFGEQIYGGTRRRRRRRYKMSGRREAGAAGRRLQQHVAGSPALLAGQVVTQTINVPFFFFNIQLYRKNSLSQKRATFEFSPTLWSQPVPGKS